MTEITPKIGLTTYNTITDAASVLTLDYIDQVSGSTHTQNLGIIDAVSGSLSASIVTLRNDVDGLLAPSGVTSGSYNLVSVDSLGRVTGGSIINMSGALMQNKSGSKLYQGMTVVYNGDYDMAFTVSASGRASGNPAVCGVLYADVENNAWGVVQKTGLAMVLVDSYVGRMDWLITSSSPMRATSASTRYRPDYGGIGISLTENNVLYPLSGSVMADLAVMPYTASNGLLILSGSSSASATGITLTFPHTVVAGADRIVLRVASTVIPNSILYNSLPLTRRAITPLVSTYYLSVWEMSNPQTGMPYNITFNNPSSGTVSYYADNITGAVSMSTTGSYSGTAQTSVNQAPYSNVGDVCFDILRAGTNDWTPTSTGQTELQGSLRTATFLSYRPASTPVTAMTWAGTSASVLYLYYTLKTL